MFLGRRMRLMRGSWWVRAKLSGTWEVGADVGLNQRHCSVSEASKSNKVRSLRCTFWSRDYVTFWFSLRLPICNQQTRATFPPSSRHSPINGPLEIIHDASVHSTAHQTCVGAFEIVLETLLVVVESVHAAHQVRARRPQVESPKVAGGIAGRARVEADEVDDRSQCMTLRFSHSCLTSLPIMSSPIPSQIAFPGSSSGLRYAS